MVVRIKMYENNIMISEFESIQKAAQYCVEYLNIKISTCFDMIERGYVYGVPYFVNGKRYHFEAPTQIAFNRKNELEEREHKNARRIWLIPSNPNDYDLESAFLKYTYLDWKRSFNYENGDILYIYLSGDIRQVRFKAIVVQGNVEDQDTIFDKSLWGNSDKFEKSKEWNYSRIRLLDSYFGEEMTLDKLREHGLNGNVQGAQKLKGELKSYIHDSFNSDSQLEVYPDETQIPLSEGQARTVLNNAYERNPIARKLCINHYGCSCQVCDINFEEIYGEVGKDFIHVHHIVPLSKIKGEYEVDPIEDLIPICPNCHAMLHRKVKNKYLSVDDLRKRMK